MSNAQLIEDKQREYRRLEGPAMRAAEYLKSPQYQEDNQRVLEKIASAAGFGYMPENEALMALGRIQQILEDWKVPGNTVIEFESVKQSLNRVLAQR